jgi:hypothetical protein
VRGCVGIGSPRLAELETYVLGEVAKYVELLKTDKVPWLIGAGAARGQSDVARGERELVRIRQEMAKLTKGWQRDIVPTTCTSRTWRSCVRPRRRWLTRSAPARRW